MSKQFEKLIAKHELERRRVAKFERDKKQLESLSDEELERILVEPDEPEEAS